MHETAPTATIAYPGDVHAAREKARAIAHAIGFDELTCEEIALVVSELGSNLIKHAGQGTLTLRSVTDGDRRGLEIESEDRGPGVPDVEQALEDGFSTTGSLGLGLGTVNRLMDELSITPRGGEPGTRIVCARWLRSPERSTILCPLDIGVATRPYPGMVLNGDSFVVKVWNESALVAVIDGLGHGQWAARAARTAREYVERHFDQPLLAIFRGVAHACLATRGVVMAVGRFDWGQARLTLAGVGNVEVRIFSGDEAGKFVVRRGILGAHAPTPAIAESPWRAGSVLVLHSDGVSTRWKSEELPQAPAAAAAHALLVAHAKEHDDATVLVVKDAGQ